MPKIFISHSWKDNDISKRLAEDLKQYGAEVWIDYARIRGGDIILDEMGKAIEWCDTLILLWSESAFKSNYVKAEWQSAFTNHKRIIPCILDNTKLPTILSGLAFVSRKI